MRWVRLILGFQTVIRHQPHNCNIGRRSFGSSIIMSSSLSQVSALNVIGPEALNKIVYNGCQPSEGCHHLYGQEERLQLSIFLLLDSSFPSCFWGMISSHAFDWKPAEAWLNGSEKWMVSMTPTHLWCIKHSRASNESYLTSIASHANPSSASTTPCTYTGVYPPGLVLLPFESSFHVSSFISILAERFSNSNNNHFSRTNTNNNKQKYG